MNKYAQGGQLTHKRWLYVNTRFKIKSGMLMTSQIQRCR